MLCKNCGYDNSKLNTPCKKCGFSYTENFTVIKDQETKQRPKFHFLFLVFLMISTGILYYFIIYNQCNLPIKYSIGNIDSRFNISKEEAIAYSKESAEKWNTALKTTVLEYDENAELKIDFIYDERQENLDKLKSEMSDLDISDSSISETRETINNKIAQYETDMDSYNDKVSYWNSAGGAPTSIYNALQNEKKELERRRVNLTSAIQLLNNKIDTYNENLTELKNEIEEENSKVEVQGVYKGGENEIDIFTFGTKNELKVVLIHELGHAIGGGHTDNPESIMYYLIQDQDYDDPELMAEDIEMVQNTCHI
jgi:flagellar motility protein MotE (MotC chaperone)